MTDRITTAQIYEAICKLPLIDNSKGIDPKAAEVTAVLVALIDERATEGWQSVETAPKDGTPILLYANVHGWEEMGMSRCTGYFDRSDWAVYGPAFGEPGPSKTDPINPQRFGNCQPTHWMPLPSPPEEKV